MQIHELNCALFPILATELTLKANTRSTGQSLTAYEQVLNGRQAVWHCTLRFLPRGKVAIPTYRALLARLKGRSNALRFCVCDPYGFTPKDVGLTVGGVLPYSDEMPHSDDTGFAFEPYVYTSSAALAGATQITLVIAKLPNGMREGCYFNAATYLHIITKIEDVAGVRTVSFEPPLRVALAAGSQIDLQPHAVMRLTDDTQGAHNIRMGRFMDEISLDLVEVFGR